MGQRVGRAVMRVRYLVIAEPSEQDLHAHKRLACTGRGSDVGAPTPPLERIQSVTKLILLVRRHLVQLKD